MSVYVDHATWQKVTDSNGVSWTIGQPIIARNAGHPLTPGESYPDLDPDDTSTYEVRNPAEWVGIINEGAYAFAKGSVLVRGLTDPDSAALHDAADTRLGLLTITDAIEEYAAAHFAMAKVPGPLRTDAPPTTNVLPRKKNGGWFVLALIAAVLLSKKRR